MNDEEMFAQAMAKVRPMQQSPKVQRRRNKERGMPQTVNRIQAQIVMREDLAASPIELDAWVLAADGVSREQLRRLAGGQPPVEREIDLHGMTRDEALSALEQCAHAMQEGQARVLCIIHGRGRHSDDGRPVLKHAVYQWLRQGPLASRVLAVVPRRGSGGGACVVLFRRQRR